MLLTDNSKEYRREVKFIIAILNFFNSILIFLLFYFFEICLFYYLSLIFYLEKLWLLSTSAKKELKNNPDYYKNLTKRFPAEIVSPFQEIIKLDLHRTFPYDEYFKDEKNLLKLKNILLAYSRRNITLGYCQGFNFIVGRIMKVVDKEVR